MSERIPVFGPVDRLKAWRELYPPALWVTQEARVFLLEKGVIPTPEVQFELYQIADENKTKKPLTREEIEVHMPRLKQAFGNGEVQQRLIEDAASELSPEKRSFDDVVEKVEVFHQADTPAKLRIRATTKRGFVVGVANIPTQSSVQVEKKVAATREKWSVLIGKQISFAPKKSPNGRLFLTITASSLPEDLRKK